MNVFSFFILFEKRKGTERMSSVLEVVGGVAVLWVLLVGAVRLLEPWLARVLPRGVHVSASWCCIAVHSERVPSLLCTLRSPDSPPPDSATPDALEPFGDTVVDLADPANIAADASDDDDEDEDGEDDDALFAVDASRAMADAQQRPARRGCRARLLHVIYRLWRLFGLSARGWHKFYSVGAVVACVLGALVVAFLLVNPAVVLPRLSRALHTLLAPGSPAVPTPITPLTTATAVTTTTTNGPALQPLIPGLAFPLNHALLMVAAVALCGAFHELGHALAAAVQGYALHAVGVELYLLVVPKFYADIDGAVRAAPAAQRLRVFCAGVWHNLVMGAAALALTAALSTAFLDALYALPAQGPVVSDIPPASPMATAHLAPGDALVRVGSCPVSRAADWDACLARISRAQQAGSLPQGFCVPGTAPRSSSHLWSDHELETMLKRLFLFLFCVHFLISHALCVHPAWKERRGNPTVAQCCKSGYRGQGQCFAVTVCFLLFSSLHTFIFQPFFFSCLWLHRKVHLSRQLRLLPAVQNSFVWSRTLWWRMQQDGARYTGQDAALPTPAASVLPLSFLQAISSWT